MKLAVIVGHNARSQGAVRTDTGETEYNFNGRIAQLMAQHAPRDMTVRIFWRRPGGGYQAEIERVYDAADAWGADATVELHFNSAATPAASGTEMLSSGTRRSLDLSQAIHEEVMATLGLRDRGVKTRRDSDRGGASLWSGKAPATLVEPFFGSARGDTAKIDTPDEEEALALAYLRGARRAMLSWPRPSLDQSRTLAATSRQKGALGGAAVSTAGAIGADTIASLRGDIKASQNGIEELSGGLEITGTLADMLPLISAALGLLAVGLTIYGIIQARRVERAREDDFVRGVR